MPDGIKRCIRKDPGVSGLKLHARINKFYFLTLNPEPYAVVP